MIKKILRKLYEPEQAPETSTFDLLVVIDNGNLWGNYELPNATKEALRVASRLIREKRVRRVAWASLGTPALDARVTHNMKLIFLQDLGVDPSCLTAVATASNSIDEAEKILAALCNDQPRSILLICDWRHAPRCTLIWRKIYKHEVGVITTDANWDQDHMAALCRSNLVVLMFNVVHHLLLMWLGVERLRHIKHKPARM